jgi:hypothetical protein
MANRVIRDWTTSEIMDTLSWEAEVFFARLIMKADDYGSFYANPKLLKAALFPLKEVTYKQIGAWVFECIDAGLIFPYEVEGKEYIRIKNFGQRLQNMRNAFPHPPENKSPEVTVNHGESPPETETKQKQETETKQEAANAVGVKDSRETKIPFGEGTLVRKAWDEWEQYRKEKKQSLTPSTIKKQIQFLAGRADPEIIAIIHASIHHGWTGLFDLNKKQRYGRAATKRTSDAIISGGEDFGTFG